MAQSGSATTSQFLQTPAGATIYVAAASQERVKEARNMHGVHFLRMANSTGTPAVSLALFEVGSGSYKFVSEYIG